MKPIVLIEIIFALLFLYRSVLSFLILIHKKQIIDEQSYIYLMYLTFVCLIVALTKNVIVGYVGVCLTPLVLIIYFLIIKKRVYWIVNGMETNLSSYGNALIEMDEKYKDGYYMKNRVLMRKVEGKIEVKFENVSLEEKEKILHLFKSVAKQHAKGFNGRQFIYLLLNLGVFILAVAFFVVSL